MDCIHCNGETKIINTRTTGRPGKRRRRECLECQRRFTTYEVLEEAINKKSYDIKDIIIQNLSMFKNEIDRIVRSIVGAKIEYTCPNCNNEISTEWDKLKLKEDIKEHNELIEECPICDKTNIIKITVEVERG